MDYHTHISVSRDEVAEMLTDSMEQTPYVLACVAGRCMPGTMGFDDFCDVLDYLDGGMKAELKSFCEAVARSLSDD